MKKTKTKRGPGRPPTTGHTRSRLLTVRADDIEYAVWQSAAKRERASLSDWVRAAVNRYLTFAGETRHLE